MTREERIKVISERVKQDAIDTKHNLQPSANFTIHARTDIPFLLSEVASLQSAVNSLQESKKRLEAEKSSALDRLDDSYNYVKELEQKLLALQKETSELRERLEASQAENAELRERTGCEQDMVDLYTFYYKASGIELHYVSIADYVTLQSKLDALCDTLWVVSNFNRTRGYPTGTEWVELIKLVNEALAEIKGEG